VSLDRRLRAAYKAFMRPQADRWVVAEHGILWRIVYRATSRNDADAWLTLSGRGRVANEIITVVPLYTVREWNNAIVESSSFWRSLAIFARQVDQARTDAMIDKAQVVGKATDTQGLKLSDPISRLRDDEGRI
jgi:hypothetical protein